MKAALVSVKISSNLSKFGAKIVTILANFLMVTSFAVLDRFASFKVSKVFSWMSSFHFQTLESVLRHSYVKFRPIKAALVSVKKSKKVKFWILAKIVTILAKIQF